MGGGPAGTLFGGVRTMNGPRADREHRRADFLRSVPNDGLLEIHAETLTAAKNGTSEPADVFPEAEFDTWKEWSLAVEAELDRRRLDHRKANL